MNVLDFKVKDQEGKEVSLGKYAGHVLLIVNTATKCGFTPTYDALQALYAKYRDKGFELLDFPCNQFKEQAPGSDGEIHNFCTINFGIEFPQFSKVDVNGAEAHPLYKYLTSHTKFGGFDKKHPIGAKLDVLLSKADPDYASKEGIKWNFTKFLIDKHGEIVKRFEPTTDLAVVDAAVKAELEK